MEEKTYSRSKSHMSYWLNNNKFEPTQLDQKTGEIFVLNFLTK